MFVPSHFCTTCTKFDTQPTVGASDMRKFFCIGAHIRLYVLASKTLRWNFIKIFLLSIRSGAHKLLLRFFFLLFAIFNRDFPKIVAPPSNKNENYLAHLKGPSEKNAENWIKIDP